MVEHEFSAAVGGPAISDAQAHESGFTGFLIRRYPWCAITSSAVALLASLVTALAYPVFAHDTYSALNHFISDLGRYGVSTMAIVFNIGLMITGVLLLGLILGPCLAIATGSGSVATVVGCIIALGCFSGGIFPMNHPGAANIFFYAGLVIVALSSLAVAFDKKRSLPRATAFIGLIVAEVSAAFLFCAVFSGPQSTANIDQKPLKVHRL